MGWLADHQRDFVEPIKATLSTTGRVSFFGSSIESQDMSLIKNAWRSAKKLSKGKTILLMGRDVWPFEVLARREGFPTIFDPRCSRQTCYHSDYQIYNKAKHVLLDTGFEGTIARVLHIDCILLSANQLSAVAHTQVFPKMKGARSLALRLEALPKYWDSGRIVDGSGAIKQDYSPLCEFVNAAKMTEMIYKDSSPRFIETRVSRQIGI